RIILIPEASVAGDDHNSGFSYREPAPVFFRVISDFDTRRDSHVLVDDHSPQSGMTPYIDCIHQDAFIDLRIAVDTNFRCNDRVPYTAAADNRSLRTNGINRDANASLMLERPNC